jgi:peptide/nickel transport system permease protein
VIGYVLRRLAIAVVLLWLVSLVTFVLYVKVPEDPASFLVDMQHASPQQIAHAHHVLGVDRPYTTQYARFVWRALHGDFGESWATINFFNGQAIGRPVGPMVWHALWVTAALVAGGFVLLLLVALPLGTLAATRPRSFTDRLSVGLSLAAISTHPLVVGLLLQLYVGNRWKVAPPNGYCNLHGAGPAPPRATGVIGGSGAVAACGGFRDWATHLILPWITFALFFVALYMRIVRARMMEVLDEPWIRTARAKGAGELRVLRAHALRNAISPVVTMVGMDAGMAIGIAMYVETVFALPGLGRVTIGALANQSGLDLPVVLGVTLFAAAAIILLNLVADLVLLAVDPRVSRGGSRGVLRAALGRAA